MKHHPFLDKWNRTIEEFENDVINIELKDVVERLALSGKLSYLNRILDLKDSYVLIFNHNGGIEFKNSYSGDYVITSGKYTYKTPHLHYAIGALGLLIDNIFTV